MRTKTREPRRTWVGALPWSLSIALLKLLNTFFEGECHLSRELGRSGDGSLKVLARRSALVTSATKAREPPWGAPLLGSRRVLNATLLSNPSTGSAVCCARTPTGHAAAPPSSEMNEHKAVQAERPCCLEVDHQLEFGWLLDRQIGGLGPLENAACVDTRVVICPINGGSLAHQAASQGVLAKRVDRG
jgi:hypothetical protein